MTARRPPCDTCPCPAYGQGAMCKDTAPAPGPEDHHPDHVNQRCLHCGDLTDDPTRCPGWLGHRTLVRFHAEGWEHDEWTGITSTNDSLGYVVTQYGHLRRKDPDRPSRLMAAVTTYHRIADPADHDQTLQQLLDGANDAAAMLNRSYGQERDRALRAEARVRELEAELEAHHAARLNEPLLRHCLFPGCLREFDAKASLCGREPSRPSWSGKGWLQLNSVHGNMCPDHGHLVGAAGVAGPHLPRWDHSDPTSVLRCACDWASPPVRWRGYGIEAWKNHLLDITDGDGH